MELIYCDKWSNIKKKPWEIIDEGTANLFHTKHKPYTVILSEDSAPKFIIDISDKSVSVNFLDNQIRKYLQYDFKVTKSGKLFLKTAINWEYEGNSDSETSCMIFGFQENGYTAMEKRDMKTGEVEERETYSGVEGNWENYPQFGHYLYLCKEER